MCRAAWLSQYSCIGWVGYIRMEAKNDLIHSKSLVTVAMALYSASAEERDIVVCFLVLQDIGDPPNEIKHPVRDFLVRGHAPQSGSQNATIFKFESLRKRIPCPGLPLIYHNTRFAASMWSSLGACINWESM